MRHFECSVLKIVVFEKNAELSTPLLLVNWTNSPAMFLDLIVLIDTNADGHFEGASSGISPRLSSRRIFDRCFRDTTCSRANISNFNKIIKNFHSKVTLLPTPMTVTTIFDTILHVAGDATEHSSLTSSPRKESGPVLKELSSDVCSDSRNKCSTLLFP